MCIFASNLSYIKILNDLGSVRPECRCMDIYRGFANKSFFPHVGGV